MLLFSKCIIQTLHYPQGVNQQVSQEKTNWFVLLLEIIIVIFQHNFFFMSFDSVLHLSKKLFPPWLLQTNNKWFLEGTVKDCTESKKCLLSVLSHNQPA